MQVRMTLHRSDARMLQTRSELPVSTTMLGIQGDLLEVLRDFLGREREGSLVDRPGP